MFGGTKSHRGRGARIISGFWEVDQGRAWVVEEPYDVASKDVGGLLDFTMPPETIKGLEPNGGSNSRGADRKRAR